MTQLPDLAGTRSAPSVRMRRMRDGNGRSVLIPAAWSDTAGEALAALSPTGVASIRQARWWIGDDERLLTLLLHQQGAAGPALWDDPDSDAARSYSLHLAAFHDPESGLDTRALADAIEAAARFGPDHVVALTGLDGLLAGLGLDYATEQARETAAAVTESIRARLRLVSPGARLAVLPAGPVDALLGVEAAGIAPAFGPIGADGALTLAARARLAARGLSPETALARLYAGDDPLPVASPAAHVAMHAAVAPHLDIAPPRPAPMAAVPDRTAGYTQKVVIGGNRLYLRAGEHEGRLVEIALAPQRQGPAFRALMDAVATSVSIGLQHGTPLEAFVDALLLTRFGPAGAVEGDPSVTRATSMLDYAMRHLAATYLHRTDLGDPGDAVFEDTDEQLPLLPPRPTLVTGRAAG